MRLELPPRIIDGIPDPDATNDAPRPRGPFYSNWGPLDGPILARDESPALGVVFALAADWSIEIACPVGLVDHRRGPAMTSRLALKNVQLEGRRICVGRKLVVLDEAAFTGSSGRTVNRVDGANGENRIRVESATPARRGIAVEAAACWGC